ncbi:unnamed protein product [Cylindrotheca closterium]|uniref:Uncharacterized protein n=1 Tax=Cylindrotheca closterium TaxID=2856 RepID=A0AAD2CI06_9STRA|nr:unnamed protein product [Cylindrotheca closterium]
MLQHLLVLWSQQMLPVSARIPKASKVAPASTSPLCKFAFLSRSTVKVETDPACKGRSLCTQYRNPIPDDDPQKRYDSHGLVILPLVQSCLSSAHPQGLGDSNRLSHPEETSKSELGICHLADNSLAKPTAFGKDSKSAVQ